MALKLHGLLNLSRIDKNLIVTNSKGEKVIWIDIVPDKRGADQYGNTHAVTIYNGTTRETTYLGNLKPQEFGTRSEATTQAPAADEDLPF